MGGIEFGHAQYHGQKLRTGHRKGFAASEDVNFEKNPKSDILGLPLPDQSYVCINLGYRGEMH